MLKKSEEGIVYKCLSCSFKWVRSELDTQTCFMDICKKCDRMVGLGTRSLIANYFKKPTGNKYGG